MDSVEQSYNRDCVEDTSHSRVHYDGYSVFGEPEILPRIGDEFQADIPVLSSHHFLQFQKDPASEGGEGSCPRMMDVGLPIPIMWIGTKVESMKIEMAGDPSLETQHVKPNDFQEIHIDNGMKTEAKPNYATSEFESSNLLMEVGLEVCKQGNIGFCIPLPGLICNSSSNEKEEAFLLGLYIFGKNLRQVKKFMESEGTGTVLSHYYGKFYGSPKYRRWSGLRKMKSRKCILGQKIFTGSRQHELFSRLLPDLSTGSQDRLLEASKTFGEGRTSFEDYVFSLKEIVGLPNMVKAMGIGQGKQDLTGLASETIKPNHVVPPCLEIPVGKACSRLSTGELVGFLTGGFRLSKARSNDLFWEAVWPRLLARGWHSEQPENGYRHALVFLVPGVQKFSRRRLVKGNQYFDSIRDVLSKVAAEPHLLDIEEGEINKEGDDWFHGSEPDEESVDEDRHCYLKPRTVPSHSTNEMKFTIVDTSRASGDIRKLSELRGLPSEMSTLSSLIAPLMEDGNVCCGKQMNASVSADSLSFSMDEIKFGKQISHQRKDFEHVALSWGSATTGLDSTDVFVEVHHGPKDISQEAEPRKIVKIRPRPRVRQKMKSIFDRTQKSRQKPGACNQSDTNCNFVNMPLQSMYKQEEGSSCSSNPPVDGMHLIADPSVEPLSSMDYETKGGPRISLEGGATFHSETSSKGSSREHPPAGMLIDLNLPVLPDADFDFSAVAVHSQQDSNLCGESNIQGGKVASSCLASSEEQQPCMNPRRQGTRNRPPTTRALEALAFGLLDTKKKRKDGDGCAAESLLRPSKRSAGRACTDENHMSGFMFFKVEDNRTNDGSNNMFNNTPV